MRAARTAATLFFAVMAPAFADGLEGDGADRLRAVISGDHREAGHKARDRYRHPFETLSFLAISPAMTVVGTWPGGGWYTEFLAPF